jgi:hypothetical protein
MFKVLFGGRVRPSFGTGTAYAAANLWEQGDPVTLSGTTIVRADKDSVPIALACEYRRSATDDQTKGANVGSVILDPAVIQSDQFASGLGMNAAVGNKVYVNDTSGLIQFTDPGSGTVIGVVLTAGTSEGVVTWLYDPQY